METSTSITSITGVKAIASMEKYLGHPAFLGKKKTKAFHSLLDKVGGKSSNWKNRFPSVAGKEVSLKSVL